MQTTTDLRRGPGLGLLAVVAMWAGCQTTGEQPLQRANDRMRRLNKELNSEREQHLKARVVARADARKGDQGAPGPARPGPAVSASGPPRPGPAVSAPASQPVSVRQSSTVSETSGTDRGKVTSATAPPAVDRLKRPVLPAARPGESDSVQIWRMMLQELSAERQRVDALRREAHKDIISTRREARYEDSLGSKDRELARLRKELDTLRGQQLRDARKTVARLRKELRLARRGVDPRGAVKAAKIRPEGVGQAPGEAPAQVVAQAPAPAPAQVVTAPAPQLDLGGIKDERSRLASLRRDFSTELDRLRATVAKVQARPTTARSGGVVVARPAAVGSSFHSGAAQAETDLQLLEAEQMLRKKLQRVSKPAGQ